MLKREEPFNGTFKGEPLSRTKTPKWPRLVNPPAELESPPGVASGNSRGAPSPPHLIGAPGVAPPTDLWDRSVDREPAMVYGRH
jgi:hypothetical protein